MIRITLNIDVSLDTVIECYPENPKNKGTRSHARWELYKTAKTIGQALDMGATREDIRYGLKHGQMQVFLATADPTSAGTNGRASHRTVNTDQVN